MRWTIISSVCSLICLTVVSADYVYIGNPEFSCGGNRAYDQWLPRNLSDSQGVGMYLAAEYGTASVSLPTGEIIDIAKVSSNPEFLSLMEKLSYGSTCPTRREDPSLLGRLRHYISRLLRRMNKTFRIPATHEAAIIAEQIKSLREAAESNLGSRISHVSLLLAPSPGLDYEVVTDAAEYLELTLLHGYSDYGRISNLMTASYAGAGLGLCKHYSHLISNRCYRENNKMQRTHVLRISLNSQTFSIDSGFCTSAPRCFGSFYFAGDEYELGWNSGLREDNPERYWATIQDTVVEAVEYSQGTWDGPNVILLHGEFVLQSEFLDNVREALRAADLKYGGRGEGGWAEAMDGIRGRSLGKVDLGKLGWGVAYDPVYLGSRGLAEMAKRIQAGQRYYMDEMDVKDQTLGILPGSYFKSNREVLEEPFEEDEFTQSPEREKKKEVLEEEGADAKKPGFEGVLEQH
ncbi:hypothetical protein ABW19_dt0202033 [Dactylella cylindrospora]|nr:hypothetical protein ABW19_dt0202033 [Dactylella cylindrospora]